MANEIGEFNRYWEGCLGILTLPRSGAKRLFKVVALNYPRPAPVIPDDAEMLVSIFTSGGVWRNRTFRWGEFKTITKLFPQGSRYLNNSVSCCYYSHRVERQFFKGVTTEMVTRDTALLRNLLPPEERWGEASGPALEAHTTWTGYFIGFFDPYPPFEEVMEGMLAGRRISGAFSRHLSVWLTPAIRWPVLFRGTHRAGVVVHKRILLMPQHMAAAPTVQLTTRLPVSELTKESLNASM